VEKTFSELSELSRNFLTSVRNVDGNLITTNLENGCEFILHVESSEDHVLPVILGVVVGGLVIILAAVVVFFLWYRTWPVNLKSLPKAVRWQYEQCQGMKEGGGRLNKGRKEEGGRR
jgi:hypothetical protein